mgnify:CR=1 FL=1
MNKDKTYAIVLIAMVFLCLLCAAWFVDTRQEPWIPLRTAVTADDTALAAATSGYTFAFADKPSSAVRIPSTWNSVDIYFYGADANDETVNYKIYGYKDNGPALLLTSGVATLGLAITGATTTFYADTITETDVHAVSAVTDSAVNRVAVLHLTSVRGLQWLYCEIDIPASTQMASASCEMTGY